MAVSPRHCRDFTLTALAAGPTSVTFDGVIDASLTLNNELVEITEISDVDRKYIAGMKSGTGSATLYYDRADAGTKQLETWFLAGTQIAMTWKWVEDGTNDQTYACSAFITSIGNSVTMNDVVRQTMSFQISGAVTMAPV